MHMLCRRPQILLSTARIFRAIRPIPTTIPPKRITSITREWSGLAARETLVLRLLVEQPAGAVGEPNKADGLPASSSKEQRLEASTTVFLETKELHPRVACSVDGRHAFFFVHYSQELVIVDLMEKTQKILRPSRSWPHPDAIDEFLVVDANTLLVRTGSWIVHDPSTALRLVRFGDDAEEYEFSVKDFFWSSKVVYAAAKEKSSQNSRLFCCRLDRKKWERLSLAGWPVESYSTPHVSPIVSPVDGEDDGIVLFTRYPPPQSDYSLRRTKIERFMFRDSNNRKEAGSHEQSPVSPDQYGRMTPIPVGCLE
ncbi:hypothetical protein M3Y99_01345600 [Aphelenchoides fujianensis]|nr:hypothetical protein M3Y99_01345600 [Aphelenchoides fujianensis]